MSAEESKIRVLIVDDVAEQRENLKKMLYFESDFDVVGTAATGEEAIELSVQHQPNIVLMDINMPGMGGIGAAEAIARQAPYASHERGSSDHAGGNGLQLETDALVRRERLDAKVLYHTHERAQEPDDDVADDLDPVRIDTHGAGRGLVVSGDEYPVAEGVVVEQDTQNDPKEDEPQHLHREHPEYLSDEDVLKPGSEIEPRPDTDRHHA